jgi:hypothetical protein
MPDANVIIDYRLAVGHASALLSAETALFQLPAVAITMGAVRYREFAEDDYCHCSGVDYLSKSECRIGISNGEHRESILVATVISLLPRYAILFLTTSMYLSYIVSSIQFLARSSLGSYSSCRKFVLQTHTQLEYFAMRNELFLRNIFACNEEFGCGNRGNES